MKNKVWITRSLLFGAIGVIIFCVLANTGSNPSSVISVKTLWAGGENPNDPEWTIDVIGDENFRILSDSTVRLLITSGGNVGIGTQTPNYKLQVNGSLDAVSVTQGGTAVSLFGHVHVAGDITSGNLNIARMPTGGDWDISSDLTVETPTLFVGATGGSYAGRVGIGDTTPAALLTVGSGDMFQVNSSGNLVMINGVAYSWPSTQGGANTVLTNDGSGNLTWSTPAGGSAYPNMRRFLVVGCEFLGIAAGDYTPFVGTAINSGTQAFVAGQSGHAGIVRPSSSTTGNSGYRYQGTQVTAFLMGGGEVAELVFLTPTISSATTIRFGYLDTTTSSDAVDGVYFGMVGTTLSGKTSNNSTRSTTGTTYTLANATWYRARLVVNSDATRVDYYLYNGAGTQLWTNNLTANIPKTAGRETGMGIVATNSGTTATQLINIDAMAFYSERDAR